MPMKNILSKSLSVTGSAQETLSQIEDFLTGLKNGQPPEKEYHLVHALVFPKDQQPAQQKEFNIQLGGVYTKCGFKVLGGDTSSGKELSVFISAIVF